jgi:glycosyltransferase involved in cell wall biosynthesis
LRLSRDRVLSLDAVLAGWSLVEYLRTLRRELRMAAPDLVHTNSLKANLLGGLAARSAGLPVVWHVRDSWAADYLPAPLPSILRVLARLIPQRVIANSSSTAVTAGGQPVVIPSPLPSDLPVRTASAGGPLRFALSGRIAPWKGQDVFLRAFAAAFPSGDEEAWLIGGALFGEAEYEAALVRLATSLGVDERVRFFGFRDDALQLVANCDVAVHASITPEPFGLVVIEAMALGTPVVATAGGGPAEMITNEVDGLLVTPGDVPALTYALRRLAQDPALRGRLARNAQNAVAPYSPQFVARAFEAVYADVLLR